MRCVQCHEELPEGTAGPFCSNECRWRAAQPLETPDAPHINGFGPRNGPAVWGKYPRKRTGRIPTFKH